MSKHKNVVEYQIGIDKKRSLNATWYRGKHCNFMPNRKNMSEEDDAIDKYILYGWLPSERFIGEEDVVTAFGSCFARHVNKFIKDLGYKTGEIYPKIKNVRDSHVVHFGSGMVNTFALRQQFEWAYEDLWYGSKGELAERTESIRVSTKSIFENTTVFILTLGLSEVWYNKVTNEVFWRAIPQDVFDDSVHGFRLSTVDENVDNLRSVIKIIKKYRPESKIIFSLSPVPLTATFRDISCISADSVSKSILRVAVDVIMSEYSGKDVFYWPSYEIVKYYCKNPYMNDNRHIKQSAVNLIMKKFQQHYLIPIDKGK